jgi:acetyl-CoA synthetase
MTAGQVGDHHAAMQAGFRWLVPRHFNIAQACSARWAALPGAGERVAVIEHRVGQAGDVFVRAAAGAGQSPVQRPGAPGRAHRRPRGHRHAAALRDGVAYMAVLQMGAIAMPLSQLFGPEALEYRLQNAAATVAICDEGALANLLAARETCLALQTVIGLGAGAERRPRVARAAGQVARALCRRRHPGRRRGRADLHQRHHRSAQGRAHPAARADRQPARLRVQPELVRLRRGRAGRASRAVFWSPADWAWTGG